MELLKTIFTSGAVVNFFLVILGSLIGLIFRKGFSEKIKNALMTGMAFCVLLIGVDGMLNENNNILVIIVSVAVGTVIGEWIDLDKWVNKLGQSIENSFNKKGGNTKIAEGFVTATLLFCVGAMTVVGSIESGISGNNLTLYSKSIIDCITAVTLASTFGIGIMLSCFSVLILQGGITLLAVYIAPVLNDYIVTQMSSVGSLLIVALALNMLGFTKIKVMNYLPAIFFPLLLCQFM